MGNESTTLKWENTWDLGEFDGDSSELFQLCFFLHFYIQPNDIGVGVWCRIQLCKSQTHAVT